MHKDELWKIWRHIKPKVAFLSAVLPLIVLVVSYLAEYDENLLLKFAVAVAIYQIGILIILALDTQHSISLREPKKIGRTASHDEFWKYGKKYRHLYVLAMNSEAIFVKIKESKISVDHVQIVAPSRKAIETFYTDNSIVSDPEHAIKSVYSSIQGRVKKLKEYDDSSMIKSGEVRQCNNFPLDFLVIFDRRQCLAGKYEVNEEKSDSVGLSSLSWVENDPDLTVKYVEYFEDYWSELGQHEAAG